MNKKKNMPKKSWKKSKLLKATFICSVLMLLLVGSLVQAIEINAHEATKSVDSSTKLRAIEMSNYSKWVRSGRELFFMEVGGQTSFIGVQTIMRVPSKIETGRIYSIPVYFTRFVPTISTASDEDSGSSLAKKDMIIQIDVFMGGGISTHSGPNNFNLLDNCFQINIGVQNGGTWIYEMPIVIPEESTESNDHIAQKAVVGFDQKIWIEEPDYRFLTDIPVGSWDGPYKIIVKIDPISYLLPEEISPPNQYLPLPIPLTGNEIESDAVPVSDSAVNKAPIAADANDLSVLSKYVEKSNLKAVKSVELKEVEGKQVYRVKGIQEGKLLWFIPIDIDVTIDVDITVGSVKTVDWPWWGFLAS